ncbi:MAG TPA: DHH family phosphoesterase [Candidatus Acidoferrum sp.]|nr:DHH family phosphoesterase [Candidatus Acidoferrum sp.]
MRGIFVCADAALARVVPREAFGEPVLHIVESAAARRTIVQRGVAAIGGDLERESVYQRASLTSHDAVVVAVGAERAPRVVAAIRQVAPNAAVVLVPDPLDSEGEVPGVTSVAPAAFVERVLAPALERAGSRARVERVRQHFASAERVLIMMQDDPDPDAIASALALKTLLGRSKAQAPIATFGTITRPENRAMLRVLEIDVEQIKPRAVSEYDMVAMVDTQPSFFEEPFDQVDLVIDHHPEETPARAHLKDIRPAYGATSTILTEYLRAADVRITQRLATALLYGISADTLHLERGATRADIDAFTFLHAQANHSALRRIERPELSNAALDVLAAGIARRRIASGVVFVHLGAAGYPELVAQFADLFLQVEGVEWSVVSGIVESELHVSVRNVGYVRAAGDVVRSAFGALGSAGGHRSMAKAVVPLRDWRRHVGDTTDDALARQIGNRFLRALHRGKHQGP